MVEDLSHNVTSVHHGSYWRLLAPGTYSLTVVANGYQMQTRDNIVVVRGPAVSVNFTLTSIGDDNDTTSEMSSNQHNPVGEPLDQLMELISGLKDYSHHSNLNLIEPRQFVHHNYDEMTHFLEDLVYKYPSIAKLSSIGQSVEGRDLWVLEVTEKPGVHVAGKPEFRYIANMHGNEVVGRELLLQFAELLCQNYGKNQLITLMVQQTRIHLMPTMNPDGYERAIEGDVSGITGRNNRHDVDLNRNFPGIFNTVSTNRNQEPETLAVMRFSKSAPFVLSANLHGGSLVANYPYDDFPAGTRNRAATGTYSKSPDDEIFQQLAEAYSTAHSKMHTGRPCPKLSGEYFPDGITNGAKWYALSGGMQDWNYGFTSDFELTLELGCVKFPLEKELPSYWEANKDSLLVFVAEIHRGVKGFVIDGKTGAGIADAVISVDGINHPVKTARDGDFWRLLVPGTYAITASATGYDSQTITVRVSPGAAIQVNFTLQSSTWSADNDFDIKENMQGRYYMSPHAIVETFGYLSRTNPTIALYETLGEEAKDKENIPILHLTAGMTLDQEVHEDGKPHILLLGGINGDSLVGTEMLIRLSRHLITGFNQQEPISTKLLTDAHVHILPRFNNQTNRAKPGDCRGQNYTGQRFNDLVENKHEVVTDLSNLIARHQFDLILNVDAGGKFVVIPRNVLISNMMSSASALTEDEDMLQVLSHSFAEAMTDVYHSDACPDSPLSGIIHGVDMGRDAPALADSVYTQYGTLMLTTHVACCKYPPASELPGIWKTSLKPLINVLSTSLQGIRGNVTDENGEVIPKYWLQLDNRQKRERNAPFFILASSGLHSVTVSAKGYQPVTRSVMVTDSESALIDISLKQELVSEGPSSYHTFEELTSELKNISQSCPVANLSSVGMTTMNQDIWMLRLGRGESGTEIPPSIMFVSGIHGEEMISRELLMLFASSLCNQYTYDSYVQEILDSMFVYIIPAVNVDGSRMAVEGFCEEGIGHNNSLNVDVGQNFFTDSHYDAKRVEQLETKAVKKALGEVLPSFVVYLRSGGDTIGYMGSSDVSMAKAFVNARSNQDKPASRCRQSENESTIQNLAPLSHSETFQGSLAWYSYWIAKHGALQAYVDCCRYPPPQQLNEIWRRNSPSLMALLREARKTVRGLLIDSDSKKPLAGAQVKVVPAGYEFTTDENGRFLFYLPSGVYEFHCDAISYSKTVVKFTMLQGSTVRQLVIKMDLNTLLFGLSPMLSITIIVCIVIFVLLFVVAVVCLQRSGTMQYDNLGFRQVPNHADDDEDDDFGDVESDVKMKPVNGSFQRPAIMKEYHDVPTSDEEEENSLWDKRMMNQGH